MKEAKAIDAIPQHPRQPPKPARFVSGQQLGLPVFERILRFWLSLFHVAPRDELLTTIEAQGRSTGTLNLLAGRYAFLWSAGHTFEI